MFIFTLLSWIFSVIGWLLALASWLPIIYLVMTMVQPNNQWTLTLKKYLDPFINLARAVIGKVFPKLVDSEGFDFSPVGLWLLLQLVSGLCKLLAKIF